MNCPKCDADISDTFERDDPECGITAGWYCEACDEGIAEWEYPREPMDDDVYVGPPPRDPDNPLGTPLSKISTQPGPKDDAGHPDHAGYAEWLRISRSWGH